MLDVHLEVEDGGGDADDEPQRVVGVRGVEGTDGLGAPGETAHLAAARPPRGEELAALLQRTAPN